MRPRAERVVRAAAGRGKARRRSRRDAVRDLLTADPSVPFGPAFFATRLAAFMRDRCPTPEDGLPVVLLHLTDGQVIDVCHVIGLASAWVALAAHAERSEERGPLMRTEVVPYVSILRVTFMTDTRVGERIGYRQESDPLAFVGNGPAGRFSAEEMLHAACHRFPPASSHTWPAP